MDILTFRLIDFYYKRLVNNMSAIFIRVVVFDATFNNISVISWQSV